MLPLLLATTLAVPPPPAEFHLSPDGTEWVGERWIEGDVRMVIRAPVITNARATNHLVIFATPNGNSIEQTLGCRPGTDFDWRHDIQHVGAQIRAFRALAPEANVVVAVIEAEGLSWPAWRKKHSDASARARRVVEAIRQACPLPATRVTLTGHSGGGSFTWAFLDGGDAVPSWVERIGFLDSNYSYSDDLHHGDKLIRWLQSESKAHLLIIAYDDRKVMLDGKPVVGPTGGTYRATERMLARLRRDLTTTRNSDGPLDVEEAMDGRVRAVVHRNPANTILHTALVGEWNGLLHVLTWGQVQKPQPMRSPRTYSKHVAPTPAIPDRPADGVSATEFLQSIQAMDRNAREDAIAQELLRGNIPSHLRTRRRVAKAFTDAAGKEHAIAFDVLPDYLAIGTDSDWVRMPMTPRTAARVAEAFGCVLPTAKMVDLTWEAAAVRREPIPLTSDRESPTTFGQHHRLIETAGPIMPRDALIAGTKKDIVVSNRIGERPNRVAIYGWHRLDGRPIQPLSVVHVNWYVDYSHGARLVYRQALVDGKPRDLKHLWQSPSWHGALSNEGPMLRPSY